MAKKATKKPKPAPKKPTQKPGTGTPLHDGSGRGTAKDHRQGSQEEDSMTQDFIPKQPGDFKPGDKIGVFIDAVGKPGKQTVRWIGWGTYEGEFVPDGEGLSMQEAVCKQSKIKMPKLVLDKTGETIYGCACYWGDKDELQEHLLDKADKIIPATVAEARTPPKPGTREGA